MRHRGLTVWLVACLSAWLTAWLVTSLVAWLEEWRSAFVPGWLASRGGGSFALSIAAHSASSRPVVTPLNGTQLRHGPVVVREPASQADIRPASEGEDGTLADASVVNDLAALADDEGEAAGPPSDEALAGHLVALLFAADEPVPLADLARLLEVRPSVVQRVAKLVIDRPPPGLLLQRADDTFQLVTAPTSARYIRRLRGLDEQARLSRASLEVLAVVAYRQPATRAEIEAIRGVNGDRALATLLARGLVEEVGRRDTVGRPVLFGTTLGFLEHLGLGSLDDLPKVAVAEAPSPPDGDSATATAQEQSD